MLSFNRVKASLSRLAETDVSDDALYLRATESLWFAWEDKKPLFEEEEKAEALRLFKRTLTPFMFVFNEILDNLNREKIRETLSFVSGLQYLCDEFRDDPSLYATLIEQLMNSEAITECRTIAEWYKDDPTESYAETFRLKDIPKNHVWWFARKPQ